MKNKTFKKGMHNRGRAALQGRVDAPKSGWALAFAVILRQRFKQMVDPLTRKTAFRHGSPNPLAAQL
ncbi:MAG TPA: hypothetical protein VI386_13370 [Candidatus Sulfotelmatobacter sp.]